MSGGQQQRVGVARALVVDPEIIFADEPTGNLDSNTSREVMELMQQVVHEKQQTLVMVTHDNHLASFADRIFHIIDGKIVRIDDMTGKSKEEREKEEKKREANIINVDTYEEFKEKIEDGVFIMAHWDGTPETEELIKNETKATIRCIPLAGDKTPGKCMVTGKPSACRVLFARAY